MLVRGLSRNFLILIHFVHFLPTFIIYIIPSTLTAHLHVQQIYGLSCEKRPSQKGQMYIVVCNYFCICVSVYVIFLRVLDSFQLKVISYPSIFAQFCHCAVSDWSALFPRLLCLLNEATNQQSDRTGARPQTMHRVCTHFVHAMRSSCCKRCHGWGANSWTHPRIFLSGNYF